MASTQTAGAPWGASAADWSAFQQLGLTADLLPVVSDPSAEISPLSKMKDKGKTPSAFNGQGHVVGIPAWTRQQSTERMVGRWCRDTRLGICVQTRVVKAIDIDIADPVRAAEVREFLTLALGELPMRYRANSGKCLLLFRLAASFPKRVIKTAHGNIELLSTGQQFIAVGTHFGSDGKPSGARYEWKGGPPARVPALSMAEVDVFWQALVDAFALPDGASEARPGQAPATARRATDAHDPLVDWLEERGWVTGYERDGRVDVRCPWEDGHSMDSGPSSTSWFPAGVGGFAQGHFKCLHASCQKRTDGDFLEKTGYAASDFEVFDTLAKATAYEVAAFTTEVLPEPWPKFNRNRQGRIVANINQIMAAMRCVGMSDAVLAHDAFTGEDMVCQPGGKPALVDDWTNFRLRAHLEARGFEPIRASDMKDVMGVLLQENSTDSAVEWLHGVEPMWDGVDRAEMFWVRYYGVQDTPYARAVGLYAWSALAARVLDPGAKTDMVPVLVGLQGAGKTTAVEALCPIERAFAALDMTKKDDDLARQIKGKLVCELAELQGLATRDAESIKAWISKRVEEWVPKYREKAVRYARRCLYFGTANTDEILDDDTGERRWLPMTVGQVDVPAVLADRDQLWAEGAHLFRQQGVMWQGAYALAKAEHGKFKVVDAWQEKVSDWVNGDDFSGPRAGKPFRTLDVFVSCLNLKSAEQTKFAAMRVRKVLTALGFATSVRRVAGQNVKGWVRAEKSTFDESAENSEFAELA